MLPTTEASPKGIKVRSINSSKEKKNIGSLNTRFNNTLQTKYNNLMDNSQGEHTKTMKINTDYQGQFLRKIAGNGQSHEIKPPLVGFNSPNNNIKRNIFYDKKPNSSIPSKREKSDVPAGISKRVSRRELNIETVQSGCVTQSEYDLEMIPHGKQRRKSSINKTPNSKF